jgi:dienelactone hydrolase
MAGFFVAGIEPRVSWTAPEYADPAAFTEETVVVGKDPWALPAMLSLPKPANANARVPAVVLVHGSGPNDADETILANKPFKDLAWGLASRGIAVLRYEKRTKAHGAKMTGDVTLYDETIDDAVSAAALLRERKEIDPERVFVLGHSLGGTAAPFIAKKDGKLRGLVILAGTPRPALDLVVEQIEHMARLDGAVSDEEKEGVDGFKKSAADIRAGKQEALDANLLGAPGKYWLTFDTLDAAGAAKSLSLPMLFLQGGRDYQVTGVCFAAWKTALEARKGVTFRLYEKLNHLFIAGEGVSSPDEYGKPGHVDGAVIRDVAEWILAAKG